MFRFLVTARFALRFSLRRFTDHAVNALVAARSYAIERRLREITPRLLLLGLVTLRRGIVRELLEKSGLDLSTEEKAIRAMADACPPEPGTGPPSLAPETERLLERAREHARAQGVNYVGAEHLVLGLVDGTEPAAEYLRELGITLDRVLVELRRIFPVGYGEPATRD